MASLQKPQILCQVRALYSYQSHEPTTISFEAGDQIDVLSKLDSGWWNGWTNGRRGWFPSNYVEILREEEQHIDFAVQQQRKALPPFPPPKNNNRRSSSVYSNASSEVSRNNANLPDGWAIKMEDDGVTWFYYNEYTGESTTQHPVDQSSNNKYLDDDNGFVDLHGSARAMTYQSSYDASQDTQTDSDNDAVQALKELMENWVERKTPQGRTYFCNLITQETTWEYGEIDLETGYLKTTKDKEEDKQAAVQLEEQQNADDDISDDQNLDEKVPTWNKLATDIAAAIRQLMVVTQNGDPEELQSKTVIVVETIRLMLFASSSLEKDSKLMQSLVFREPRRSVMSSLSKLVLSSKMASETSEFSVSTAAMFQRVQRDANDILVAVRNFITICQQQNVIVGPVSPVLIVESTTETSNPLQISISSTLQQKHYPLQPINKSSRPLATVQKMKHLLNQDLVSNLQAYSHQIYGTTEELLKITYATQNQTESAAKEQTQIVLIFKTLSNQITQYMGVLDSIQLDGNNSNGNFMPSIPRYLSSRQSLYTAIGHLFGSIQKLTCTSANIPQASHTIHEAIIDVEDAVEAIEKNIILLVNERKRIMGIGSQEAVDSSPLSPSSQEQTFIDSSLDSEMSDYRYNTRTRRQHSLRENNLSEGTNVGSQEDGSNDIELGADNSVKGGTLPALVERLTVHNTLDTNFITTFLLTYRSFCTTEEFITLLEERYNILPPERLTPEQLEMWTEQKQKLVRLRVFNVLKNWLESYYIDEDEYLLNRIEHFTNSIIRDYSDFAANQLQKLIRRRIEMSSHEEMKKIVPNPISGPEPILPRNMTHIQLLETDPLEMARQLSVMDFGLYSRIRAIECLGKAWSREGADGSVAKNIKQSIDYCNRLTAWVTESILSYDEVKKRAIVVKYWVQVADHCRSMNNYNTCMAVLSAFDNSAVGRLKKTWTMTNKSTIQTLTQIRKLLGANRNFTEYREIIHSVNPPCIPFLGIYLQDLTFIEDGNHNYLRRTSNLINFAKRQKTAEVLRDLKQFQSFAYNFHAIPELQDFIKTQLDYSRDVDTLYEKSLILEPKATDNGGSSTMNSFIT